MERQYDKQEKIREAVKAAIEAREKKARTFRSKVGVAFCMYDGTIIDGFNAETSGHKGYHAEEVAILKALDQGYNGVDFDFMVEVFQDGGHDELEIYPACPSCWNYMLEFAHNDLEILVADVDGNVQYSCKLNEIIHPPAPGQVYPSEKIRKLRPKTNSEPKSLKTA